MAYEPSSEPNKSFENSNDRTNRKPFFKKSKGKFNGWIGYTLSWSTRTFENLNFGKTYPYKYDRRHDASLVISHALTKNIDIAATWVYGTGNAVTLPIARYNGVYQNNFQQGPARQYPDGK